MEIYRSVGVATIAALMGPEHDGDDRRSTGASGRRRDLSAAPLSMAGGAVPIRRACERAVVTAYRELRAYGEADRPALQACATLYRIHHPEASVSAARMIVASWIDHHITRRLDGPTPGCDCD